MNVEYEYKFMINATETELIDYVMDNYIYTEEQLDDLIATYKQEIEEIQNR